MGLVSLLNNLPKTVEPSKRKISLEKTLEYYLFPTTMSLDELLNFNSLYINNVNDRRVYIKDNCVIDTCYSLFKYNYYRGKNHKSTGYYIEIDYSSAVYKEYIRRLETPLDLNPKQLFQVSRACISYARGIHNTTDINQITPIKDLIKPTLQAIYKQINYILYQNLVDMSIVSVSDFRFYILYRGDKFSNDIKHFRLPSGVTPDVFTEGYTTTSYIKEVLYNG